MNELLSVLKAIEAAIWGAPVLLLLVGVSIFLTFLLRGMQVRYLFRAFRLRSKGEESAAGDISAFQSLMTAMASAVGTGSIVGVSTAIMAGGLGAVLWMWVMTFLGMSIKYAESLLAVKYRIVDKRGEMAGGPMYYIEKGLGWKWMAILFAVFASIATFGTGNLVQVNSIAGALNSVFHIPYAITGVVLAGVTALVLLRGIQGIGFVSAVLVPIMGCVYIVAGTIVLFIFRTELPAVLQLILSSAVSGQAATGGFLGATVMMGAQMGISRSVFSSEAGLGIASIASAAARTQSSGRQALLSMAATLLSTAIICTVTALVIGVTGVMGSLDETGLAINGAPLAIKAFSAAISGGSYIVTFGLVLFAYTTVIAWAYYGEKCCEYLFGERSVIAYRIFYTLLVIPGSVFALDVVWTFANIMNGLMIIPNMVAILALSGVIQKETNEFIATEFKVKKDQVEVPSVSTVVVGES